jgi:hypothetical protein
MLAWLAELVVPVTGDFLYMGTPAMPVFKSSGSEKAAGPKDNNAKLMFATWPLVQPLIAFSISTLATYFTAIVALAICSAGSLQASAHDMTFHTPVCN